MNSASHTIYFDQQHPTLAAMTAERQLTYAADALFELIWVEQKLSLRKRDEPKLSPVNVDFTSGAVAHRRKFGGGRGQEIAKAAGLKQGHTPTVLDATAGLGRDAFVLASLGCQVMLLERHPVVAALLADGLQRAYLDPDIGPWMQQRMQLLPWGTTLHSPSLQQHAPDVIYLDPMYPHRDKSALVKKEMRLFQSLVGADEDADALFAPALQLAQKRVVVKRPDYADVMAAQLPTMTVATKKNRFDVYVKAAMM